MKPHPLVATNPNLTNCPDCKGSVSKTAEKCPHCGQTLKQTQSASGIAAAIFIGLVLGWFFFFR